VGGKGKGKKKGEFGLDIKTENVRRSELKQEGTNFFFLRFIILARKE